MEGAGAGDAKPASTGSSSDNQRQVATPPARNGFIRNAIIAGAGALLTGGFVAAALVPSFTDTKTPSPAVANVEPTLSALASSEIAAASPTLDPATSEGVVADAKRCKTPLARVVLVKRRGTSSAMVRIRSGSYFSPTFHVTDIPQRIAIPFPSPYPTGRGVLSLVGDANDLWFYLTPGRFIENLNGVASINVIWATGNPC